MHSLLKVKPGKNTLKSGHSLIGYKKYFFKICIWMHVGASSEGFIDKNAEGRKKMIDDVMIMGRLKLDLKSDTRFKILHLSTCIQRAVVCGPHIHRLGESVLKKKTLGSK